MRPCLITPPVHSGLWSDLEEEGHAGDNATLMITQMPLSVTPTCQTDVWEK